HSTTDHILIDRIAAEAAPISPNAGTRIRFEMTSARRPTAIAGRLAQGRSWIDRTIEAGPVADRTTSDRHRIASGTAPAVKAGPNNVSASGAPTMVTRNSRIATPLATILASPTLR